MKSILISLLLCLGLFGCQNKNNQTFFSIEKDLANDKSDTSETQISPKPDLRLIEDKVAKNKSKKSSKKAKQDSIEFISFFELFRNAVLEYDKNTLSKMFNDSIVDASFFTRNFIDLANKVPKKMVLEKFYDLFTPDYLLLLRSYDIHKDLYPDYDENEFQKYQYEKIIGKKTYNAGVNFYKDKSIGNEDVVTYYMGCYMENPQIDFISGGTNSITFNLIFHRVLNEFKLHEINFIYLTIADG